MDRRVFGRLEQKELVQSESHQIPNIFLDARKANAADPKIKQSEIPQNAIEQLQGKRAIRSSHLALR